MKSSHAHVLSCALAELGSYRDTSSASKPLRILDTGCGYGGLIADALVAFAEQPQLGEIEIYGFEILEHGAGREQYWEQVLQTLETDFPEIPWKDRIRVVSSSEDWPFESEFFDLVWSNQVLEHVADLEAFLAQQVRVLSPGGLAIHHFPAKESLVDPHSGVPFAHWPKLDSGREAVLRFFSILGVGKYPNYRAQRGQELSVFVNEFVDYLRRFTSFRSASEVESMSEEAGFDTSYRYNGALVKRWIGEEGRTVWQYCDSGEDPWIARILSRFASVTLRCRKL